MTINDEYCWTHVPGGWTCQKCRKDLDMYGFEGFFEVLAMACRSWAEANGLGDGTGWYFVIEDGMFRLL